MHHTMLETFPDFAVAGDRLGTSLKCWSFSRRRRRLDNYVCYQMFSAVTKPAFKGRGRATRLEGRGPSFVASFQRAFLLQALDIFISSFSSLDVAQLKSLKFRLLFRI